ncbi:MAG: response regulator [Halothiobacillaceae bacterium]
MTLDDSVFSVLLIEDEPADAHLIRMAFDESRLLVRLEHTEDGADALDYLNRRAGYEDAIRPDLILVDLNMPRMDGRGFLKAVKKDPNLRSIPVVVLTTSQAESDVFDSYDLGAAGFIVKPLDVNDFIEQVRALGDYWITLVRRPPEPIERTGR